MSTLIRPEATGPADRRDATGHAPAVLPRVHLVRHGETEWARSGRHTGRTDVPLTETGRRQAVAIRRKLAGRSFSLVLSSPLARALETARLSGLGGQVVVDPDLREWDYGVYEGRTSIEIRETIPGWTVWTHPIVDGETLNDVARRADRVIERARAAKGDVALFGHGHQLRILTARWLGLPPSMGRAFALSTATVSVLGWERETPVVEAWNEACHLVDDD
jgi:broad specificity phosphatase PhoE